MEIFVEHDEISRRFDLTADGKAGGYLTYEVCDGSLDIQHTVVCPEMRGRGLGEILVTAAAEYARSKGLVVSASCGYARKILVKMEK